MKPSHFIVNLKKQFSSEVWPWLAVALRQDSLIWESLENTSLGTRALAEFAGDSAKWAPAPLALLDMHDPELLTSLIAEPLQPVSGPLRRMANQAFQDWQNRPRTTTINLAQAGLIALALREYRILNDSWENIGTELINQENIRAQSTRTALACLYGMLADPLELLLALLNSAQPTNKKSVSIKDIASLVNHILLSNPLQPEAQTEVLYSLFLDMTLKQRLSILDELKDQRPHVFEKLIQKLQANQEVNADSHDIPVSPVSLEDLSDIDGYLEYVSDLVLAAETNRLGIQPAQAMPFLIESLKTTRKLQAQLAAKLGQVATLASDLNSAVDSWKQAAQLHPENPPYTAELALALLKSGRAEDARAYLTAKQTEETLPEHPSIILAEALVAHSLDDRELAEKDALKVLSSLEGSFQSPSVDNADSKIEFLKSLANLLFDLDLFSEALKTAQIGLKDYPSDTELLKIFVQAQFSLEQPEEALNAIHLATALKPEDTNLREMLVECLESAGEWPAALIERSAILEESQEPSVDDLYAYAYCALQAGEPIQAAHTCREALQADPENGLLYGLLGQATLALGDQNQALEYFHQATQLAPQEEAPWLALAQAHKQIHQMSKAIEILRTASLSVPNSPLIQLALGEACIEENAPTQALSSLRQAASLLKPKDGTSKNMGVNVSRSAISGDYPPGLASRIALQLGKTLYNLGHLEESRQVLEQAYSEDSKDPALAYAYSKTILDSGEYEKAIGPLEVVVQAQPDSLLPYLEYARALLKAGEPPQNAAERAISALNHVLESCSSESEEFEEAISLLAEAFATAGDLPKSRDVYRQALDTQLAQDPNWRARLALGLGRVTMALKEYEIAIAALQEAMQADPQDPQIHRSLSEAYLATGLIADAFQAAHAALRLNSSDLDTLSWFAVQALRLSEQPGGSQLPARTDAIQALKRATQLDPTRSDLIVKLGQMQQQNGNHKAARETFSKLNAIDNISREDLYNAAKHLRDLDDPRLAIELLDRAASEEAGEIRSDKNQETPSLVDVLVELSNAHRQVGDPQAALQTLDKALSFEGDHPALHVKKADLLLDISQADQALVCIKAALELDPTNANLHLRIAQIYRMIGELPAALNHAEQAIVLENGAGCESRSLATDLARSMLQFKRASEIIHASEQEPVNELERIEQFCLRIELELDAGDDSQVSKVLASADKHTIQHPRCQAAQARLAARQGDPSAAIQLLESAIRGIDDPSATLFNRLNRREGTPNSHHLTSVEIPVWQAVGEAALELAQWRVALYILEQVAENTPHEPLSHYHLARGLVLRAEAQRLCMSLDVIQHAPGVAALSDEAFRKFETALQSAETQLDQWFAKNQDDFSEEQDDFAGEKTKYGSYKALLTRWRARGQAVFHPAPQSAQALEAVAPGPDVVAALVSTLGSFGEQAAAAKAAQAYPQHPWVLLQLALVLAEVNPRQALGTASTAVEYLSQRSYKRPHETPLRYYLLARLAHNAGDQTTAMQAIQTALESRPDEPRWHALAAEVYLKREMPTEPSDRVAAISHLEEAVRLEPKHAPHYLKLGQTYLENGDLALGIRSLEQATRIAPAQVESWLALAKAQQTNSDLELAAASAERAIEFSIDPIPALLLRGEIALKANNPRGAQSRAQAVLHIDPENPEALILLAHALQALSRPEDALACVEKAIPLVKQPLHLLLERAELLRAAQQPRAALEALQEVANQFSQEPLVLAPLAEALMSDGRHEEAVQTARLALQVGKDDLTSQDQANLMFLLGRHAHSTGQLDQAIYYLSQTIQFDPENLEAYLELGNTYQERRQYAKALIVYQQAISVAEKDHRPYYQAGIVLKESKDYLGAESMLRRAAKLAPNDVSIHRLLGAVVALNLVHNRSQTPSQL
jgi:tetratricopeptide (TPR) repeat protein